MQAAAQQSTINPVFAGYAAQQLQEATGGIDRVFDNLLDIAWGNDPSANGYDRLRATRVLYDRGFGKVTKNQPRTPSHESERDPQSEESNNHTNHSSDTNRPVAKLEQKLEDVLGPPQAPGSTSSRLATLPPSGSTLCCNAPPDSHHAIILPLLGGASYGRGTDNDAGRRFSSHL